MPRLFSFTASLALGTALLCAAESRSALETDPKGWKDLTPAKGWVRYPIPVTATLSPDNQWRYDPKLKSLICTGDKGHEIFRSARQYTDFIFHVEWRFQRLDGEPKYNSGVFVRTSENGEYMTQAQIGPGPNVWLFADYPVDGKKTRVNLRDQMTAQRVHGPGEWNTYEITVRGPKADLWVNGETIGSMEKIPLAKGYVGLEAEGFYIEFKNVKIKELR
jgi:hypothetical protein